MALSERYQERRDQLVSDLELTGLEQRFVAENYRTDVSALRVARLISDYMESDESTTRRELLRLLILDAIPAMRASMAARLVVVPSGYVLLSELRVKSLDDVIEAAQAVCRSTGKNRDSMVSRLKQVCETAQDLNPECTEIEVRRGGANV